MGIDLIGQSGDTPFALRGSWNFKGDGTLDISTTKIALTDIPFAHLLPKDLVISDGTVHDLIVTLVQQANKLSISGEGSFEKVAATISGFTLGDGTGKFRLADGKIDLQKTSLLVNGQGVVLDGFLSIDGADLGLNLNAVSTAFAPETLTSGSALRGSIAFQSKVEGTAAKPTTTGTFSMAQGTFNTTTFTNANGNFSYNAGKLVISDAHANAWDGTLTIAGEVLPATEQYNLTIQGTGVDSSLLTDKDIHGRIGFNSQLSGQGINNAEQPAVSKWAMAAFLLFPFRP